MPTAKFLTLTPQELLQRYADEKPLQISLEDFEWTIPQVCIFDNSLQHFSLHAIQEQFDTSTPEYRLPAFLEKNANYVLDELGSGYHNSSTIRLNQIIPSKDALTLVLSKAHYFDYLCTNYAMDAPVVEQGQPITIRDMVHPEKKLCSLDTSPLANHIGVGALLFTSDNYLILPMRSSEKVAIGQQTISPSISGTSSYDEDIPNTTIAPLAALIREGREELGLDESDFDREGTVFLGISRELLRGGKPEFFFLSRLSISKAHVEQKFHTASDRWENEALHWFEFPLSPLGPMKNKERQLFQSSFLRLFHHYQGHFSYPIQANLALWFKYMTSLEER